MKKIFLLIYMALAVGYLGAEAAGFGSESLHYVISYKWGLIHKDAGEATLSLRQKGNHYESVLTARTKPWADKIYKVRDTLLCTMRSDLHPISYTKITHEKGKYARDVVKYTMTGNTTYGNCTLTRMKDGHPVVTERKLSASGPVYDMMSVFYFLRSLDYKNLGKDKTVKATVFSGKKAETITIRNLGLEQITLKDKSKRQAYHIRFRFTQKGGKKSSDDIDTWISTDAAHIPLYLVGKLPIGEVRAHYLP